MWRYVLQFSSIHAACCASVLTFIKQNVAPLLGTAGEACERASCPNAKELTTEFNIVRIPARWPIAAQYEVSETI